MKRALTSLLLSLCFGAYVYVDVHAQTSTTGNIGFTLSNAGRVRVGVPTDVTASRQVGRMTINAALNKTSVFDYQEDANVTTYTVRKITVAGVDSAYECISDNSYTTKPPKIRVRNTVMGWKGSNYLIVRFRVINDSTITYPLYLGTVLVPQIGATYGGETVQYESTKKVGYYFRTGQNNYIGVKLLGKDPFSVKILDWDNYSTDPNSDIAPDSVRYQMTAGAGFDAAVTAGVNGSIYNVNAGLYNIAANDSAQIFYAVAYGTSLSNMLAVIDTAVAKYTTTLTSVQEISSSVPTGFALEQNYPNPFNPSTQIQFSIAERSPVTLTVHDLLGRKVQTLTQGVLDAGTYSTRFDASSLTSGIYYYTLTTGNHKETKKMLLMK
jgi:hypothetical protein